MKNIKGIIVAFIGVVMLFVAQQVVLSYIGSKIPAKSSDSVFYLEYKSGKDIYYAVTKDVKIIALFLDKQEAENLAGKVGGFVEVFDSGK